MDENDIFLTDEEIELYFKATRRRIKEIEKKAIKRLLMPKEELEERRAWKNLMEDPAFVDIFITLLIASTGNKTRT